MRSKLLAVILGMALLISVLPTSHAEAELFSQEDLIQEADTKNAIAITLNANSAQSDGNVAIEAGRVTIRDAGVYILTGQYQGSIVVDAGKKDSIQLVLDNVQITSETFASIYVKKAEKVSVILNGSSTMVNGGSYEAIDENDVDSVIFSKTDLVLKGSGYLTIQAKAGHGIVSKDTLIITGGNYDIQSERHGLNGKDAIQIAGGSFRITTGGGSENAAMKPSDAAGKQWGQGRLPIQTSLEETIGTKGIKSNGSICIQGGIFTLDCADDAIHAGGDITIDSGDFSIRTADDAIHSDTNVTIQSGSFDIPYCYEGIEGETITVNGGTIRIISTDDGLNAAGGADNSGYWGGFSDNANAFIEINGGEITVVSDGDSLDSNGRITLNGGILNLTCNGYGNTAIDYESGFTNNGAEVTTNDGSENGTGMMHGGRGPMGGDFGQFGGRGNHNGERMPGGDMGGDFGQRPDFPEMQGQDVLPGTPPQARQ